MAWSICDVMCVLHSSLVRASEPGTHGVERRARGRPSRAGEGARQEKGGLGRAGAAH